MRLLLLLGSAHLLKKAFDGEGKGFKQEGGGKASICKITIRLISKGDT